MMRYLSVLLLLCTYLSCNAQESTTWDVDSLAKRRAQEILATNRTSDILVFNEGCIGCEVMYQLCECSDGYSNAYLIWQEGDTTMVERIDCCLQTYTKQLSDNKIWEALQSNKKAIFNSAYETEYDASHYSFWYLQLLPSMDRKHQIFDVYFDEKQSYQPNNSSQPSNLFRLQLLAVLREHKI